MKSEQSRIISWNLSLIILLMMILVSAVSLIWPGLYRDNPLVKAVWRGNDLVTLAGAVPLLGLGLWWSRRGSPAGDLIRLGVLDYTLYNYAFYSFAAAFNALFLPYVLLLVLSTLALIAGLISVDPLVVKGRFSKDIPVKGIAGYLIFVALGLSVVYLIQTAGFIFTGQIPEIIEKTGHVTHIVPALDLSLLVPWLVLGGVWIWKRKPWGYVLSSMMIVKGVLYNLVLTAASLSSVQAGFPESAAEIPLWGILFLGFLILGWVMVKNFQVLKEAF